MVASLVVSSPLSALSDPDPGFFVVVDWSSDVVLDDEELAAQVVSCLSLAVRFSVVVGSSVAGFSFELESSVFFTASFFGAGTSLSKKLRSFNLQHHVELASLNKSRRSYPLKRDGLM